MPGGPILIDGPVEIVLDDGETITSDRFVVALCACRRSRRYPFCDTSHRRRVRPEPATPAGSPPEVRREPDDVEPLPRDCPPARKPADPG